MTINDVVKFCSSASVWECEVILKSIHNRLFGELQDKLFDLVYPTKVGQK